jgi:hypothetical protein
MFKEQKILCLHSNRKKKKTYNNYNLMLRKIDKSFLKVGHLIYIKKLQQLQLNAKENRQEFPKKLDI